MIRILYFTINLHISNYLTIKRRYEYLGGRNLRTGEVLVFLCGFGQVNLVDFTLVQVLRRGLWVAAGLGLALFSTHP